MVIVVDKEAAKSSGGRSPVVTPNRKRHAILRKVRLACACSVDIALLDGPVHFVGFECFWFLFIPVCFSFFPRFVLLGRPYLVFHSVIYMIIAGVLSVGLVVNLQK